MDRYKDLMPRTQADRYNHAILEQLIKLNDNLEKLIPKEIEKPKKVKRGEANV